MIHLCTNCDWSASTAEADTAQELGQWAVDHYVETGHAIVSDESFSLATADERAMGVGKRN